MYEHNNWYECEFGYKYEGTARMKINMNVNIDMEVDKNNQNWRNVWMYKWIYYMKMGTNLTCECDKLHLKPEEV